MKTKNTKVKFTKAQLVLITAIRYATDDVRRQCALVMDQHNVSVVLRTVNDGLLCVKQEEGSEPVYALTERGYYVAYEQGYGQGTARKNRYTFSVDELVRLNCNGSEATS